MDPTLENRIELLESAISELQTQQIAATIWREGVTSGSYELFYEQNWKELALPIQSSITLPKWYRAENNSGTTLITAIEEPNNFIDDESFENIINPFFGFFGVVAWWLFLGLFAYYIKFFLFSFLFPKDR